MSSGRELQQRGGQLARRGRVHHDLQAGGARRPGPREHRRVRDLEAQQRDAAVRRAQRRLDGIAAELGVGARGDGDLVLARVVDHDQRDPGRAALEPPDPGDVDPLGLEQRQRLLAEVVVADGGHHPHARAEARRRHGLVGALAAAVALERPARHRLARARERRRGDDEIDVDRAHDIDVPRHRAERSED